uniref:Uncharacterized protein n=1 Tax=Anguilla anguilla TaxID=7936 RepID=A0A0E9SWB3_ANGAN
MKIHILRWSLVRMFSSGCLPLQALLFGRFFRAFSSLISSNYQGILKTDYCCMLFQFLTSANS